MFRKLVLLSTLLLTSVSTQAALISHFGYERDSASNIVIGGGLEWLKWDVTKGMSISSALSKYASQGWRVASNNDMANMFNRFTFGKTNWHADESVYRSIMQPWNSGDEFSAHAAFIRLFGATEQDSCYLSNRVSGCFSDDDPYIYSAALFGTDEDNDGYINSVRVIDDATFIYTLPGGWQRTLYDSHWAEINEPIMVGIDSHAGLDGVALVRNFVPGNVAVPTPGTIGLLALGLVALGYRRHVLGR